MDHGYKSFRHPLNYVVEHPVLNERKNVILNFSIYSHEPQSFNDRRKEFKVGFRELNENWLVSVISSLAPHQELSFHSVIEIDNERHHMPMIDLGGRSNEIKNVCVIEELSELWNINLDLYSSGRSYHAYGDRLLTGDQWVRFMGSLLLLNVPGKYKIVDTRWVGHRLMGGYSSLRWSNNTTQYKRYPTHLGKLKEILNTQN